ncbi:MAG: sugar phosphate isomerase/epimerase [Candidatus Omnitrophica bacterium]|nr:sugar phosphate isomerase/epimerase [Candidatus Omnitrophota bacterium]
MTTPPQSHISPGNAMPGEDPPAAQELSVPVQRQRCATLERRHPAASRVRIYIGNQTAYYAATPVQPFEYAVANGFEAFEWFPDKKADGTGWDEDDLDVETRAAIRKTAQVCQMRLSVHARWDADPFKPESDSILVGGLALARDLGAALFNIHLAVDEGIAAYVRAILPFVVRSAELGLQIAIENTPVTTPEHFNRLFSQIYGLGTERTGHVGMCLDIGHANLCPTTLNDYLGYLDQLDRRVPIIHLHLHENYGDRDAHLPLFTGPSGKDPTGVRGLLERLKKRRFSGSFILEQWPEPPALLNQAYDRLRQLLSNQA